MTGKRERRPSDVPLVIIGLILFSGYVVAAAIKGAFAVGALVSIIALSVIALTILGSLLLLRAIITRVICGPSRPAAAVTISPTISTGSRKTAYQMAKQIHADRIAVGSDVKRRAGSSLFISKYDGGILGIDRGDRQIILGTMKAPRFISFDKIIDAEIVTDGVTITKTNRGSQAIGATVGVLALGPVGLLAGGLTGSKRGQNKLAELSLKITVEDWDNPVHTVRFLKAGAKGVDPNHRSVKPIVEQVDRLYANLVMAMRSQA